MTVMKRLRPWHALLILAAIMAVVLVADYGLADRSPYTRVAPDQDGFVRIDISQLANEQVKFYRFLNWGNQEVKFFVGRDGEGQVQVAFDANEICFKRKRGYEHSGEWMVCRVCDKAFRLAEVNDGGGGCKPVPVAHRVEGDLLLLAEDEVLRGWRYFR
ncbi:MAG: Fe-S-containing protein [Acidobacteriota bacterium]